MNAHNLPEAYVNVITRHNQKPVPGVVRASALPDSPQIDRLRRKHWDEIVIDVSDQIWSLLGTSVHYILHKGAPEDSFAEEEMIAPINGVTLTAHSDMYHNQIISDYKVTSVWSFLLGLKSVWIGQLNIYCWMWRQYGYPVKGLRIYAILRDWMKGKSLSDPEYPKIPFIEEIVPIWSMEQQEEYILSRINIHRDSTLGCTDEERWMRPTTYACMKEGNKKATRVFNTILEAETYIKENNPKLVMVERKGTYARCEGNYCNVAEFCEQWQRSKGDS